MLLHSVVWTEMNSPDINLFSLKKLLLVSSCCQQGLVGHWWFICFFVLSWVLLGYVEVREVFAMFHSRKINHSACEFPPCVNTQVPAMVPAIWADVKLSYDLPLRECSNQEQNLDTVPSKCLSHVTHESFWHLYVMRLNSLLVGYSFSHAYTMRWGKRVDLGSFVLMGNILSGCFTGRNILAGNNGNVIMQYYIGTTSVCSYDVGWTFLSFSFINWSLSFNFSCTLAYWLETQILN